jgi:hypothetical protein
MMVRYGEDKEDGETFEQLLWLDGRFLLWFFVNVLAEQREGSVGVFR